MSSPLPSNPEAVKNSVQRLRDLYATHPIIMEAADEIERLSEIVRELVEHSGGMEYDDWRMFVQRAREALRWEGRL